MIQVIAGEKGSGKTKKMLKCANDLLDTSKGNLVYISNNSEGMFELNSKIRLIDISQFPISSADSFIGFLYGLISEDYDVEKIYIDNLSVILKENNEAIKSFFKDAKIMSEKYEVKFCIGVRHTDEDMSQFEVEYVAV